jgi:hypothetical protein
MISLRTHISDNNETGVDSSAVGFAVPVGVVDGDVCIVSLVIPAANVTVTPPDGWTLIRTTDKTRSIVTVAYWKIALNEGSHWVFGLSSSVRAVGIAAVYANTDPFTPVEVSAGEQTASGTSHNVAGATAALEAEHLIYVLGCTGSRTFTAPSGFQTVEHESTSTCTGAMFEKQLQNAGNIAATTVTVSASEAGASLTIVLAPSFATHSIDEVRERIVGAFPVGVDRIYDLTSSGDYYKLFQSIAAVLKLYGYDTIDTLRREAIVALSRYVLPVWEGLFGIRLSKISQTGTIPQRQNQVVSYWRSAAGQASTRPNMAAAIKPLLGYNEATDLEIIETDRSALTTLHTGPDNSGSNIAIEPIDNYPASLPYTIPTSSTVTFQALKKDGPLTSQAGFHLLFEVLDFPENVSVIVVGPNADGTANDPSTFVHVDGDNIAYLSLAQGEIAGFGSRVYRANANDSAGCYIEGVWSVRFRNHSASDTADVDGVVFFMEAIGRENGYDGLGAAAFEFGVFADAAHVAESGRPADFPAVREMIGRLKQAHTIGNLIQSISPYPDTDTGEHAAIPDECIPT